MSLVQYFEEFVKIITPEDDIFSGFVEEYFYPDENDLGIESIVINDKKRNCLFEFVESDIKSIEII